jgi:hypothetical protein
LTSDVLASVLALAVLGAGCGDGRDEAEQAWPPFWEVSFEGQTSILLGTMHDMVDADELPPRIWDELRQARVVVTEADVRSIDRAAFRTAVSLPEGQSVRAEVSQDDWTAIVEALDGVATAEEADRLQPWYTQGALVRKIIPTVDDPIDTTLVDEAVLARVQPAFLETWQEQVEMLNGLGIEYGVALLLDTVHDPDATLETFEAWAQAYRAGDIEQLEALSLDPAEMAGAPEYFEQIVFARGEAWLSDLEVQLRGGDAFVAVGFMHMPGDRGLVRLLEAGGFTVTQVVPR